MASWLAPVFLLGLGLAMIARERRNPGRRFEGARLFYWRAWALSLAQAAAVWGLADPVDAVLSGSRPWSGLPLGPLTGAAVGYLLLTFAGYWWHRARHSSPFLWRWLHQLHHSPGRIEVLTSFYKHPLEIVANVSLSSLLLNGLLGLSAEACALATLAAGSAELIYHWNVSTPRWLGFFFQRPEMHCVHHARNRHGSNYGDLPLWDMIFGTYHNPESFTAECGFGVDKEEELLGMLVGVDVFEERPRRPPGRRRASALLALGCASMMFDLAGLPRLAGLAMATAASPAPKVFTSLPDGRGGRVNPFADRFEITVVSPDGETTKRELSPQTYSALDGPYNRRNTYGAVVAGAAFLEGHSLTAPMWRSSFEYMACGPSEALDELGLPARRPGSTVLLRQHEAAPSARTGSVRTWSVECR